MGNLPCCNANEEQKPTAFSTHNSNAKNKNNVSSDGQLTSPLLSNSKSQALSSQSQTSDHNLSNYNSSSPSGNAEKYQLLEQQRALLQKEQERLERIVNDAGWAMVHVNGTAGGISTNSGSMTGGMAMSPGGGGGGSSMKNILMGHSSVGRGGNIATTTRAMGYYDANYAAEVWQDLIPGRNGGGLIAMCQKEIDSKQEQQQQQQQQETSKQKTNTRASLWKTVPKGVWMDSSDILERLNNHGSLNGGRSQLWNEESVRLLNELIVTDTSNKRPLSSFGTNFSPASSSSVLLNGSSGVSSSANHGSLTTATMNEGESMERLVDDLAEKFLASVFQEGRLDGLAPIVENVL